MGGEQGETIYYLSVEGPGVAALGLRERRSDAHGLPYDRYAVGVHHPCFEVPSREVVDERAQWLGGQGARIEGGPAEYGYTPCYYAVFFYDPTGSSSSYCTARLTGSGCAGPSNWTELRGSSPEGSAEVDDLAGTLDWRGPCDYRSLFTHQKVLCSG